MQDVCNSCMNEKDLFVRGWWGNLVAVCVWSESSFRKLVECAARENDCVHCTIELYTANKTGKL